MNEDRLVCTFFTKIGACRHGEKCSRKHLKPAVLCTILIPNFYVSPSTDKEGGVEDFFDNFYMDVFVRLAEFGEITGMVVCENANYHLNGNVYVRYKNAESAQRAVIELNQCWFNGRPVHCELSPVENFSDANCRAYDNKSCSREYCNFMHTRRPSGKLKGLLYKAQQKSLVEEKLERVKKMVMEGTTDLKEDPLAPAPTSASTLLESMLN